jgi:hypothetical protein
MSFFTRIRSIAQRSETTLLQDAIGVSALFAMLIVGLYLPVLV